MKGRHKMSQKPEALNSRLPEYTFPVARTCKSSSAPQRDEMLSSSLVKSEWISWISHTEHANLFIFYTTNGKRRLASPGPVAIGGPREASHAIIKQMVGRAIDEESHVQASVSPVIHAGSRVGIENCECKSPGQLSSTNSETRTTWYANQRDMIRNSLVLRLSTRHPRILLQAHAQHRSRFPNQITKIPRP